jgi:hypothetical protein
LDELCTKVAIGRRSGDNVTSGFDVCVEIIARGDGHGERIGRLGCNGVLGNGENGIGDGDFS